MQGKSVKSGKFCKGNISNVRAENAHTFWCETKDVTTEETLVNVTAVESVGDNEGTDQSSPVSPDCAEAEVSQNCDGESLDADCDFCYSPTSKAFELNISGLIAMTDYREVVELGLLAEGLKHCKFCDRELSLCDALGIRPYGLSGILYVPCKQDSCGLLNLIHLGKWHHVEGSKAVVYDVNTKCANGKFT